MAPNSLKEGKASFGKPSSTFNNILVSFSTFSFINLDHTCVFLYVFFICVKVLRDYLKKITQNEFSFLYGNDTMIYLSCSDFNFTCWVFRKERECDKGIQYVHLH